MKIYRQALPKPKVSYKATAPHRFIDVECFVAITLVLNKFARFDEQGNSKTLLF